MQIADTTELELKEFELIRSYIEQNCGILVGDDKAYLIESRLAKLVVESGCDTFEQFYNILKNNNSASMKEKVIDAMTTNETLWFRDKTPFELLSKEIIPQWAKSNKTGKFRIWSSACSTGQEPYSVAMTIDNYCSQRSEINFDLSNVEIIATDISPSVLFIATNGRYDALSIKRGLDKSYKEKYFEQNGRIWTISENIKKSVSFIKFNLQDSFMSLGTFDLIICRNVLIYFSDEFKTSLFDKFQNSLAPDGNLILGSAESTLGLTDNFERLSTSNGIYYKNKGK